MKIERSSLHTSAPVRRKDKAGGGDDTFAESLGGAGQGSHTQGAGRSGGVSNMDSLLALQEVPEAGHGQGQARKRSERILQRLEELRDGLLMGRMSSNTIRQLADEVDSARAEIDDPQLSEILDEIDLRAQVELAKLRR